MPRATWKGFLRLSLVACPIALSPATTRTKTVRLNRVWGPEHETREEPGLTSPADDDERDDGPQVWRSTRITNTARPASPEPEEPDEIGPATRVALRPHYPATGVEVAPEQVHKGYEYERGRFITFTPEELKALDAESSRMIDMGTFVPRAEVDPVYFNAPYYVYPDGPVASEPYRVIAAAMADTGMAGLGKLTLSRREPRPRTRGDWRRSNPFSARPRFNPRPRTRGDSTIEILFPKSTRFNPRPRTRGDRIIEALDFRMRKFQSTPPYKGRRA